MPLFLDCLTFWMDLDLGSALTLSRTAHKGGIFCIRTAAKYK